MVHSVCYSIWLDVISEHSFCLHKIYKSQSNVAHRYITDVSKQHATCKKRLCYQHLPAQLTHTRLHYDANTLKQNTSAQRC